MSQEKLSKLNILSIEKNMLTELKYKNLINNFVFEKKKMLIEKKNQKLNKYLNIKK
jgi:hypothetical protein